MNDNFKPVLIGGREAVLPEGGVEVPKGDPTNKEELLELLEALKLHVEKNRVIGLVIISVEADGRQSELMVSEESLYSILGRVTAMAGNLNLNIASVQEDEDFENEEGEDF